MALVCLALFFVCIDSSSRTYAQQSLAKKQLEHADYDLWNTMSRSGISRDGNWAMYLVQNGASDGEATLTIRSLKSAKQYVIDRAANPQFTWDSKYALYRITPSKKKIKQLKKDKAKPKDLPKAIFQILELGTGELTTIDDVQTFKFPAEDGGWVACLLEESTERDELKTQTPTVSETYEVTKEGLQRPAKPLKLKKRAANESQEESSEGSEKKEAEKPVKGKVRSKGKAANVEAEQPAKGLKKSEEDKKAKKTGSSMLLVNLETGVQRTYPDVQSFAFNKNGTSLAFSTSVEAKKGSEKKSDEGSGNDKTNESKSGSGNLSHEAVDCVYVINLETLSKSKISEGTGSYKNLAFSDDGKQLAFITDKDDYESKTSSWSLYHWKSKSKAAKKIACEGEKGIHDGWWIAPNSTQRFAKNGKRLYFETAPIPEEVLKQRKGDEADEEGDVVKLDVWHWQDPQLQPQQLLQARRERNRDYQAAYVLKSRKIVQLATLEVPNIAIDFESDSTLALASTNLPYRKMMSWDVPGFNDAYLVNLDTGNQEEVLHRVKWFAQMSPEGKFITWFDGEKQSWFAKTTDEVAAEAIEISSGIEFPLYNELHDTPSIARPYGTAGWLIDDQALLIYDRFDIWKLDPTGKESPVCVTNGEGRENDIQYRYRRLNREERAIDPDLPLMLSAFDTQTKASGYSQLTFESEEGQKEKTVATISTLIMLDENISGLSKAQESDRVIFSRSTFQMCPDLWASDLSFKKIHRLSDMNPQQEDYTWGTAELVDWESADKQKLQGILYKPEGFDPSKKYPMMVYFYERYTDDLHRYYSPAAGRSIINFSFYVSRGYLVFVPDIPYKTGEPGQSAANAILPGVESLIAKGFVDQAKIGMQGHSWGGYQTAYLVTQTDMFACAESGAPVSNMTSAYGGIRWSSGMSRMFQYERTQSRIGDDLWSARDKYIRNSPVFFADKVNTPLLILHNDEDGAVPWYQGIEMFVALRRLEKPAWMLNYNGNPHWVMGDKNRRDFAIRMQQFFDHYLMGAPEPEWMAIGVPAVKKGKEFGLELLEPIKEKEVQSGEETEIEPAARPE
jgi:dipeptidyl aminopeptidase/acylaminoacyl peptidase